MKWSEMSTLKKVLFVLGLVCAMAYVVLTLLELFDIYLVHEALGSGLFGIFWLCEGLIQKEKKSAIWYYVFGAVWFLICLLNIFV